MVLCSKNLFNCIKNKCSRNNFACSYYVAIKYLIFDMARKLNPAKYYITPSNVLKQYVETTTNIKNIKCIPNSLDKEFLNIKPLFANNNYFLFIFLVCLP